MGARPQRRFSSLADSEKATRRHSVAQFNKQICKKSLFPSRKRYGCIDFGDSAGSSSSSPRKFSAFYDHQILAAHHLICKNWAVVFGPRWHGSALQPSHGLWPRRTRACADGSRQACAVPIGDDGKALIICPPTTFAHWRACIEEIVDLATPSPIAKSSAAARARSLRAGIKTSPPKASTTRPHPHDAVGDPRLPLGHRILLRIPYVTRNVTSASARSGPTASTRTVTRSIPSSNSSSATRRMGSPFSIVVGDEMPLYCNPTTCVGRAMQFCCSSSVPWSTPASPPVRRSR